MYKMGVGVCVVIVSSYCGMLREHNDRNGASRSSLTLGSIQSDVDKSVRSDTDD